VGWAAVVTIPDEAVEAAAKATYEADRRPGANPWEEQSDYYRATWREVIAPGLAAAAPAMLAAERERIAAAAEEMADELEFDVFLQDIVDARNAVQDLLHRLAAIARGES
jgi:hypothetical protein